MGDGVFKIDLPNARATYNLGICLGQLCPPGTVLLLLGDLGSGKTTLVQGIGAGLGIAEPISSPTFTLINEYLEGRMPLYHVDLYRLDSEQVGSLELESYWDATGCVPGLLAIEWSERILDSPKSAIRLKLGSKPGGGRWATVLTATDDQVALLEQVICDGLLADEV
ncbi:tRNA (adenosine(37)-N6)-threonylcarbamoyltransferase complex ATPase subunit type 1 TsaE [Nodosilinea sp. LEGE 06152]|uniref:tRNA (adenosine(37)-N6)-threonylcarbamoyltransferase complex ATPase subunit type 1 TsaE n=1 Tax=Nodosilinea sp. LEGE 06152 TaxID=2777966 RepID=UPI0018819766|nr:tRNA (adenosine(37)-N6)-threonylcarbamoyltransferase complex ATPase subunit type 1 TsaE [Nodosilinea sp. LEGE 06152]MBE9158866.1 tRNA (adenosine(37)-N6)-threonylcarbamoyltransferase complex ATPase subunit type 1 TsaE [Nodosilinea sp. LEGE 06152]